MSLMPNKLDLREALFVPPACDEHVERIIEYWAYAKFREGKGAFAPPLPPEEVLQSETFLTEHYPNVMTAVDKTIIRMMLHADS